MIVSMTGVPGTGKTYFSKKLSKKLGWKHIEMNKIVKKEKLYNLYDRKTKSYIVDNSKLINFFKKFIKRSDENIILDGHISHILPSSLVDKVIVLRCKPNVLEKRLKRRGYSKEKIKQNIESELIGLIAYESRKMHKSVFEVDTTKNKKKCMNDIISIIKGTGRDKRIDWCKLKFYKGLKTLNL